MKLTTTLRARGSTEAGRAAATMTWGGSWWLLLLLLLLLNRNNLRLSHGKGSQTWWEIAPHRGEATTTVRSTGAEDQTRRFYLHVLVLFK